MEDVISENLFNRINQSYSRDLFVSSINYSQFFVISLAYEIIGNYEVLRLFAVISFDILIYR